MNNLDSKKYIVLKDGDFQKVSECVLCGGRHSTLIGYIRDKYTINNQVVLIDVTPDYSLRCCDECKIMFKTYFTKPKTELMLQDIWNRNNNFRWHKADSIGLQFMANLVKRTSESYFNKTNVELLDIGPGEGGFLKLVSDTFSCSGLELNKELNQTLKSDFNVYCFNIENILPRNLYDRFDIVTVFDVFEHFSRPNVAIRNINNLLSEGGLVFIETGNFESYPARSENFCSWWYVEIVEHKVCWGVKTLSNALISEGFEILKVMPKAHKGQNIFKIKPWIKYFLYKISPALYAKLTKVLPPYIIKPKLPWKDHMLIIAKKNNAKL